MAKINFPLTNGFYEQRSLPFSAQRCVGWFPSFAENDALTKAVLYGTPGIPELENTGALEANRGAHVMAEIPYFVNGSTLYKLERTIDASLNETFTAISKGTVVGSDRVSMSDNGVQLCIVVPGVTGYIYNHESDVFEEISDPNFVAQGRSERVVFVDGFFVHTVGKIIFHSELNDGLVYNALDFGAAEADPDNIVSSFVLKNQLFILGRETIEVFANVGKFPFTFQRIPGYFQSIGCFAPFSTVLFDNMMAFVGGSTNEKIGVFVGAGQSFQRVSTTPIEQKLQSLTSAEIENTFCWAYSEDGAIFLGVTAGDFCFVFDRKASQLAGRSIWHERRSLQTETLTQKRWRVQSMVQAFDRILVGDVSTGLIGELDLDVRDEYGEAITRRIATQPLTNQGERLFVDEIEITVNSGATTDDTADPQLRMRTSDNNITFGDERLASMGKQGQYDRRLFFRRLGNVPRFRTFEFIMSDKSDPTLIKAEVRLDTVTE